MYAKPFLFYQHIICMTSHLCLSAHYMYDKPFVFYQSQLLSVAQDLDFLKANEIKNLKFYGVRQISATCSY